MSAPPPPPARAISSEPKRVLFLHSALSGYFVNSLRYLANGGHRVLVMHYPVSSLAPFLHEIQTLPGVQFCEVDRLSSAALRERCLGFDPDIVSVTGWNDQRYQWLARRFKRRGRPVLLELDNPWANTFRQRLASALYAWRLHRRFTHAWVAGREQYEFARRLGFDTHSILSDLYTADAAQFGRVRPDYSRTLLFVGRLIAYKSVDSLYRAFVEVNAQTGNRWRLRVVGVGDLRQQMPDHPAVDFVGFVQPEALPQEFERAGAFCLPSTREHWGVVVNEAAAAGLPILLSDGVSSYQRFLINNHNGWVYRADDHASLSLALRRLFASHTEQRRIMGDRSRLLAATHTPEHWVARLLSVLPPNPTTVVIPDLTDSLS